VTSDPGEGDADMRHAELVDQHASALRIRPPFIEEFAPMATTNTAHIVRRQMHVASILPFPRVDNHWQFPTAICNGLSVVGKAAVLPGIIPLLPIWLLCWLAMGLTPRGTPECKH
jgi:hypothetical protein